MGLRGINPVRGFISGIMELVGALIHGPGTRRVRHEGNMGGGCITQEKLLEFPIAKFISSVLYMLIISHYPSNCPLMIFRVL